MLENSMPYAAYKFFLSIYYNDGTLVLRKIN